VIDAEFAIKAAGIFLNAPGRSDGIFTRVGGEFDIQPLVSQQPPPAIFISSQLRANATQAIERERDISHLSGRLAEICMPHVCRLHHSIISAAEI
jgi:hypothetical protein